MSIFDTPTRFILDGQEYVLDDRAPEEPVEDYRRFTYGEEPLVIAQIPVVGGGRVEIHGYAVRWVGQSVAVMWSTEVGGDIFSCWTRAEDVRRVEAEGWRGVYVPR